jgi:hypothetical protein
VDSFELGRLSDHDFEALCCDLLGEVLGVRLEIFSSGTDQGIDLRYASADGSELVIVQCKHWPRGDRAALIRHLVKAEVPKIRRLSPSRYVIATSVELTVDAKEKLLRELSPYVTSTGDIYGRDEIAAELRGRPEVVRRHPRLWLSGTEVLQQVLDQGAFLRSALLRDDIERYAKTFVPHDGFRRASDLLDSRRIVILTGLPGVGKTTVAAMLMADLAQRGYEIHDISEDVSEAHSVWRDGARQAFLYDDFLGSTGLDVSLGKNEDKRILAFIRQVMNTPDKALVMTTRDYILESARKIYEKLGDGIVEGSLSTVRLADLDDEARAHILYNHVYYSVIRVAEKRGFADPAVWRKIIRHRNFNPRLIAETLRLYTGGVPAATVMLQNLDEPRRIWEHIIENQLPNEAVHVLEILFTLPDFSSAEDLRVAWMRYRRELRLPDDRIMFRRAFRILDGTMLRMDRSHVVFHNPSIADYMNYHMNAGRTDLRVLLLSLRSEGQVMGLVGTASGRNSAGLLRQLQAMPDAVMVAIRSAEDTVEDSISEELDSFPRYLCWVLEAGELVNSQLMSQYVSKSVADMRLDYYHRSHLVELAEAMRGDRFIDESLVRKFTERLAHDFLLDLEMEAERDNWQGALDAYGCLQRLPFHDREYRPSDNFLEAMATGLHGLGELSELNWESAEMAGELLGLLRSRRDSDDLREDFVKVERMVAAEQEAKASSSPAVGSGDPVGSPRPPARDAAAKRRIELLMGQLTEIIA